MRRIVLALALLPAACLAQSLTYNPSNVSSDGSQNLTPGIRSYPGAGLNDASSLTNANGAFVTDPNGQRLQATPNSQGKLRDEGKGFTPNTSQTAAEQGYVDANNAAASARAAADYQALHTPRQQGIQVPQPAPFRPVATDRAAAGWFANWSYTLIHAGVPEDKIEFEAHRLDRPAFEAWANRQLMTSRASL